MTDEPEIPVETVAAEILPAPKRRGGKKAKSGVKLVNKKHRRVVWLGSARVLDVEAYHRLRDAKLGAKKIARALSTTVATAQKLMAGKHWQQDPEKVREFNLAKGASIDPETGVPTPNDLAKFGTPCETPNWQDSQGEKDLRAIVENAGVGKPYVAEAVRRLRVLSGAAEVGDLPDKVDAKWLQDAVDNRLGTILTLMDSVTMAGASVADLTRAANMLFEKRALLRGEPTAIVRNEQRSGLDKVAAMLLAEVGRRGITLDAVDLIKGPGGYQEVDNAER